MVLGDATHFAMKDEVIMGMQSTSECFKATRRLQHLALTFEQIIGVAGQPRALSLLDK
jgi:hypothetical protein